MENAIIERIKWVIEKKRLSPRSFAQSIGFNYSTLNNYLTGRRSSIDNELVVKIVSTFDDISSDWLLRGEGPMLKQPLPSSLSLDSSIGVGHIGNNSSPIIQNQAHSQSSSDKKNDPLIFENRALKFEVEQLKKDNNRLKEDNGQLKEDVNFLKKQIEELKLQNQDLQNRLLEEKDRFINYITQSKS